MTRPTVRRRHVFFLSGFDPKGASYYHGLYQREAALQGGVTGVTYQVGPRTRRENGNTCWQVRSEFAGEVTETVFEYVRWDDIVRANWPRRGWDVLVGSVQGYCAALASLSALRKVWQSAPKTLVSLAWPAVFWLLALVVGLALGLGVATVVRQSNPALTQGFAWGAGLAAALAVWWATLNLERRLSTTWLLRIYQFAGNWSRGGNKEMHARLDLLARDIRTQLRNPEVDEVLLVGFSVGSMLAVSAAAKIHRVTDADSDNLSRLSLMTLGHCIPLLGLMANADAFRAELAILGQNPQIHWVDFSAPSDWGSFALIDPLALCLGPKGQGRPHSPQMMSPRFHLMFEPALYAKMVKNKRRMHIQYLMAGQRPVLYDYFAITAGQLRLAERFNAGHDL